MSNLQLNKLKSRIKNGAEVTLNLLSNVVVDVNFSYKLFLTNTQVLRLCKDFANASSANIKFSKTHLLKMVKLRRFIGLLLGVLYEAGAHAINKSLKNDVTNIKIAMLSLVWKTA